MPSNDNSPNFALLSEFDASQWSGQDLFTQGSTQITMPTFSQGAGFYLDALIFLNGRATESNLSLPEQLADAATFGSNWKLDLDANDKIYVEGIKNIEKNDIDIANSLGYKVKLLAFAELLNNRIYQRVHPTLVKNNTHIASIDGVLNAVIVDGIPVGQSIIQGDGAGPAATTSALISDISSIMRGNIKFPFSLSSKKRKKLKFENIESRVFSAYYRFEVLDKPGVLSNITNIFSKNKTSIKRIIQNPQSNKKNSSVIIITHSSRERYLIKILKEISKKKYIKKKPKLIRIDE